MYKKCLICGNEPGGFIVTDTQCARCKVYYIIYDDDDDPYLVQTPDTFICANFDKELNIINCTGLPDYYVVYSVNTGSIRIYFMNKKSKDVMLTFNTKPCDLISTIKKIIMKNNIYL